MIPQERHHFIDWMKAVGMFLIVFGHVTNPFSSFIPFNPKQLGVAFFVFVLGWSLANEKRKPVQVIFNRLLPIYFWGIAFAVIISVIFLFTKNDLNLSNYMPFFLGINVFVDYFPANPTTWYIGTYLHLVLLWALLFYRVPVKAWMLVFSLAVEILSRALIINSGNPFIAYMLLSNWLSLFLLGMFMRSNADDRNRKHLLSFTGLLMLVAIVWYVILDSIEYQGNFPFFEMQSGQVFNSTLFVSFCVSSIYLMYTFIFFQICRRLPENRVIRFFSDNTLIIFIVHMPVIYSLSPIIYSNLPNVFFKKIAMIVIAFLGLAIVSFLLQKLVNLQAVRKHLWNKSPFH